MGEELDGEGVSAACIWAGVGGERRLLTGRAGVLKGVEGEGERTAVEIGGPDTVNAEAGVGEYNTVVVLVVVAVVVVVEWKW